MDRSYLEWLIKASQSEKEVGVAVAKHNLRYYQQNIIDVARRLAENRKDGQHETHS
jgi:hypothetical protein